MDGVAVGGVPPSLRWPILLGQTRLLGQRPYQRLRLRRPQTSTYAHAVTAVVSPTFPSRLVGDHPRDVHFRSKDKSMFTCLTVVLKIRRQAWGWALEGVSNVRAAPLALVRRPLPNRHSMFTPLVQSSPGGCSKGKFEITPPAHTNRGEAYQNTHTLQTHLPPP